MAHASLSPPSSALLSRVALVAALLLAPCLQAADAGAPHAAHPRELFLAGGSLRLCASLSPKDCDDPSVVVDARSRAAPRYLLDEDTIDAAANPLLWRGRDAHRAALFAVLSDLQTTLGTGPHDEDALREALAERCVAPSGRAGRCANGNDAVWRRIDDDDRAAVLAALEQAQLEQAQTGDGLRRRERASLGHGRSAHGADILRAFVAAARARAQGATPRIAVVTASAFDPFDPVDLYLDAFSQAGAEVEWWPVDAAVAAAVFEGRGCARLPSLRIERLRLPGRDHVYPDLVAQQARACADQEALARLPDRVQGVFFAGGDQWKLRRAFFDAADRPNAWLLALRAAVARGDVVIGGTSAGSAVQSAGPMLSNGSVEQALARGAIAAPPPVPGCARAGSCGALDGNVLDENAFTYWPAGGLALAPGLIVDTHFSERARELRLLRLLTDTGHRWGIGADETSALHLRWIDEATFELRALGASGGWLFDAASACQGRDLQAQAYYLAPGATLRVELEGARFVALPEQRRATPTSPSARDALDPGALRGVAQRIAAAATDAPPRAVFEQPLRALKRDVTLARTDATVVAHAPDATMASIGPLRFEVADWPGCGR
jgi:cyanophycinase-like exopeptidase